ncbi:MAG: hypothetical protein M3Y51_01350 [Actinomycetota bacterium]|nr:hypothetical protein [Actinomycetota bacterium]
MRRTAVAVVAFAVVALAATGCSSSPEQVTASMTSPPRPAASELAPEDPAAPSVPGDPTDPTDEFELPEEFSEGLDDFGSGIDDMLEQFESELGVAGECLDLLMKYAELMASAFGMMPGSSSRESVVAELRAALPADLHDELQVISDALASVESGGISGMGALADEEFTAANDAIVDWLETSCGAPSAPGEGS